MFIRKINEPVFKLPGDHPARRFLDAFVECRLGCVGKELDGIDQEWFSQIELRTCRFSSFAYEHLAFDIELDGWLQQAKGLTASEEQSLQAIPRMEVLIEECRSAAADDGNAAVLVLCDKVRRMLIAWRNYLAFRIQKRS